MLRIKDDWHRRPAYPHHVGGLEIYTAVIEDGVRTLAFDTLDAKTNVGQVLGEAMIVDREIDEVANPVGRKFHFELLPYATKNVFLESRGD